jgi:hypothetical protein
MAILDLNLAEHFGALILASLANTLLLFPLSYLSSRVGAPVDLLGSIALQESALIVLLLLVMFSSLPERTWRWGYVLASFLFIGYAILQMASRFIQALDFISQLQASGVDVQGYLAPSYAIILGSTISLILTILLLRRSYGRLIGVRTEKGTVRAEYL